MDTTAYPSKMQPQNERSAPWNPSFEVELARLREEFDQGELQQMKSIRAVAHASVANPAVAGLPPVLREFLEWAAGRDFMNGKREWSPVFTPQQIREYMVSYALPLVQPTKIPIAMDGGGLFYMVDLASAHLATYLLDPVDPIEGCRLLAESLGEALVDGRSQFQVAGL